MQLKLFVFLKIRQNAGLTLSALTVPDGYFTFGPLKPPINEWWGCSSDFPAVAAQDLVRQVTLDFADWMNV